MKAYKKLPVTESYAVVRDAWIQFAAAAMVSDKGRAALAEKYADEMVERFVARFVESPTETAKEGT